MALKESHDHVQNVVPSVASILSFSPLERIMEFSVCQNVMSIVTQMLRPGSFT